MSGGYAILGPYPGHPDPRAVVALEATADGIDAWRALGLCWVPDEVMRDAKARLRLLRETAFARELRHPHLLRVRGLERFDEGWAQLFDHVDGVRLDRLLEGAEAPTPPEIAARVVLDLAAGLQHAHEEGGASLAGRPLVHGAVRPELILVGLDGRVVLSGFGGSAGGCGSDALPAGPGRGFLAPEQILGGRTAYGVTTDVYALGAVLYDLVTGRPPFDGEDDVEGAIMSRAPAPAEGSELRRALGQVALDALAKRASERPATAGDFASRVEMTLAEHGVEPALPEGLVEAWIDPQLPPDAPERAMIARARSSASALNARLLSPQAEPPEDIPPDLWTAARAPQPERRSPSRAGSGVRRSSLAEAPPAAKASGPSSPGSAESPAQVSSADPALASAARRATAEVGAVGPPAAATAPSAPPTEVEGAATPAGHPAPNAASAAPSVPGPTLLGANPPWPASTADVEAQPATAPTPWPAPPPGHVYPVPVPIDPRTGQPVAVPDPRFAPGVPGATAYPGWPPAAGYAAPVPRAASIGGPPQHPNAPPAAGPPGSPGPLSGAPPGVGFPPPRGPSGVGGPPVARPPTPAHLLANPPVPAGPGTLLPGLAGTGRLPPADPDSQISQFDRQAGDGSRFLLYLGVLAAFGLIAFLLFAPGDAPEVSVAEHDNALDRETAQAILTETDPAEEDEVAVEDEVAAGETEPGVAVKGEGTLSVRTDPRVTVFLGDDRLGRTPLSTTVPAGRYRLRLTDRETGINVYRTVRVNPDGEVDVDERFGQANLLVNAPVGARIFLNGRLIAEAPMRGPTEIYEGSYVLRVNYQGMRWTERFRARPGERLKYDVEEK